MKANPRVLVFMYYDTNEGYEELARTINEDYCKEHGYTFVVRTSGYDDIPPWWRKVFLLRDLMDDYPQVDYYMWMDSDAAFVKQRYIPIGTLFDERDGILHIGKDPVPEHSGVYNAGVFAIKNNSLGREFVKDWVSRYDSSTWCRSADSGCDLTLVLGEWKTSGGWAGPTFEQGVMNALAASEKYSPHVVGYDLAYFSELDPTKVSFVRHLMGKSTKERQEYFNLTLGTLQCYSSNASFRFVL